MKTIQKQTTFILLLFLTISTYAQSWQFAESFGGMPGGQGNYDWENNKPQCMEVDDEGNTYVFGTYGATTQFNDSVLPCYTDGSMGSFIVKYNCAGEVVWHKAIANTQNRDDRAHYMILKDNHIYISGTMSVSSGNEEIWWIDTTVVGFNISNEYPWIMGDYNYIIKMDLNGNIQNIHRFRTRKGNLDNSPQNTPRNYIYWRPKKHAFAIDNEGNYYLFVEYLRNTDFNIFEINNELVGDTIWSGDYSQFYNKTYLVKLDSAFNLIFQKPIVESMSNDSASSYIFEFSDIKYDNENNLYVVGKVGTYCSTDTAINQINLGNNQSLTTYGHRDKTSTGFLLKMNSEGEVQWTQQTKQFYSGIYQSMASFNSLILDESTQSIYVSGKGTTVTSLFPNIGTILGESDTLINMEGGDLDYIAKYDMQGNYHWFITPNATYGKLGSISLYSGQIYAPLRWEVTLEHQDSTYQTEVQYVKSLTVCAWDTEGNPTSSINIPSTCASYDPNVIVPFDLRVNNRGEISITGTFAGSLTFGDSTIYADGGVNKMFVAKYGKACPTVLEKEGNFCYGDTYRDTTLLQSGTYQFVVETTEADSVITLNATVHPPLVTGLIDTAVNVNETLYLECVNQDYDSYHWSTGSNTYYENLSFSNIGTETVTIALNDEGCSGVDTIFVQVKKTDGIDELEKAPIYIYPNPAKKVVYLQDIPNDINTVEIWDITGKMVKTINLNQTQSINIENLKQGVYFIKAGKLLENWLNSRDKS